MLCLTTIEKDETDEEEGMETGTDMLIRRTLQLVPEARWRIHPDQDSRAGVMAVWSHRPTWPLQNTAPAVLLPLRRSKGLFEPAR